MISLNDVRAGGGSNSNDSGTFGTMSAIGKFRDMCMNRYKILSFFQAFYFGFWWAVVGYIL
jgi:hypothetical protein